MICNIIWDLNGALFDTYPAVTYAFSKTLNGMGYSIALNVIDGLVRQSFEDCVTTLSLRFKLDPDLLTAEFTESYRTISPANQPMFPGARNVCEFIHQTGGHNIAFTQRVFESTQKLLDAHNLSTLIDDIISTRPGFPSNPDSAILLAVLEKHHLNPVETLLLSTHDFDIQVGRAAGVRTCQFGKNKLVSPADFQIETHNQLLSKLTE